MDIVAVILKVGSWLGDLIAFCQMKTRQNSENLCFGDATDTGDN